MKPPELGNGSRQPHFPRSGGGKAPLRLAQAAPLGARSGLGTDEEDEPGRATDRNYWITKGSEKSVKVADELLALLHEIADDNLGLKYNKHYIGLSRDGIADNFMSFRARKDVLIAEFRIPRSDEISALIEDSGVDKLDYEKRWGRYRLRLTKVDVEKHRDLLVELIRQASETPAPTSD